MRRNCEDSYLCFSLIRDTLEYVVRNSEIPPISYPSQDVARYIKDKAREKGVTQAELQNMLNRGARSYVSVRLNGLKAWDLDELDTIAPALGYSNAFELISAAHKNKK